MNYNKNSAWTVNERKSRWEEASLKHQNFLQIILTWKPLFIFKLPLKLFQRPFTTVACVWIKIKEWIRKKWRNWLIQSVFSLLRSCFITLTSVPVSIPHLLNIHLYTNLIHIYGLKSIRDLWQSQLYIFFVITKTAIVFSHNGHA